MHPPQSRAARRASLALVPSFLPSFLKLPSQAIVSDSAPTCGICGANFVSGDGDLVIEGMSKFHAECHALGRPAPGKQRSRGGLRATAEAAEELVTVKVSRGSVARTFFFVKDHSQGRPISPYKERRAKSRLVEEVTYRADDSSRFARPSRRIPGTGPLAVSLLGVESPAVDARPSESETGKLRASCITTKNTFTHTYDLRFLESADGVVTALSCVLSISDPRADGTASRPPLELSRGRVATEPENVPEEPEVASPPRARPGDAGPGAR